MLTGSLVSCNKAESVPNAEVSSPTEDRSTMVKKLSQMESGYAGSTQDWREFLACWASAMDQSFSAPPLPKDAIAIKDVEGELPPSYRHFVEATGGAGWLLPGDKKRFGDNVEQIFPIKRLGLFKTVDPVTWKAWDDNRGVGKVSDKVYYDYSRQQDWG